MVNSQLFGVRASATLYIWPKVQIKFMVYVKLLQKQSWGHEAVLPSATSRTACCPPSGG
jgi:hypothetical protein